MKAISILKSVHCRVLVANYSVNIIKYDFQIIYGQSCYKILINHENVHILKMNFSVRKTDYLWDHACLV